MRYALFLAGPAQNTAPGDDYFCVIDDFEPMVGQVEEFRSWEPLEYEPFTDKLKEKVRDGRAVTLNTKSKYLGIPSSICIRPFD